MSHDGNQIHLEQKYQNLLNELLLMKKKYKQKLIELDQLEVYYKSNINTKKGIK